MSASLYLHIPFCLSKCHYCDFYSLAWGQSPLPQKKYADALVREWSRRREMLSPAVFEEMPTVFFGGGTPSLMEPATLAGLLTDFGVRCASTEITLEMNPKTAGPEKLNGFKRAGINRVSVGVQSLDDTVLERLGRAHNAGEALDSLEWALGAGFKGVNLDIMYGLPYQDISSLASTLKILAGYPLTHLSAYELILEEGTPFFKSYRYERRPLPDTEEILEMRAALETFAREKGLESYEISNWAKPGLHCLHNRRYWDYESFLGLGAGAVSFLRWEELGPSLQDLWSGRSCQPPYGLRWTNPRHLEIYQSNPAEPPVASLEWIDRETAMAEFMMMGLRKKQGICYRGFEEKFGAALPGFFHPIFEKAIQKGWMESHPQGVRLTLTGWQFSSTLMQEFFPPIDRNL